MAEHFAPVVAIIFISFLCPFILDLVTVTDGLRTTPSPKRLYGSEVCDPAQRRQCGLNALCIRFPGCRFGTCKCVSPLYKPVNSYDCGLALDEGDSCGNDTNTNSTALMPEGGMCDEATNKVVCYYRKFRPKDTICVIYNETEIVFNSTCDDTGKICPSSKGLVCSPDPTLTTTPRYVTTPSINATKNATAYNATATNTTTASNTTATNSTMSRNTTIIANTTTRYTTTIRTTTKRPTTTKRTTTKKTTTTKTTTTGTTRRRRTTTPLFNSTGNMSNLTNSTDFSNSTLLQLNVTNTTAPEPRRCICKKGLYPMADGTCRQLKYGDKCNNDTECNPLGYEKYLYSMICSRYTKTCICNTNHYYYPVAYITDPDENDRQHLTYNCQYGYDGMSKPGDGCTEGSKAGRQARGSFCVKGTICISCPEDTATVKILMCRPLPDENAIANGMPSVGQALWCWIIFIGFIRT